MMLVRAVRNGHRRGDHVRTAHQIARCGDAMACRCSTTIQHPCLVQCLHSTTPRPHLHLVPLANPVTQAVADAPLRALRDTRLCLCPVLFRCVTSSETYPLMCSSTAAGR